VHGRSVTDEVSFLQSSVTEKGLRDSNFQQVHNSMPEECSTLGRTVYKRKLSSGCINGAIGRATPVRPAGGKCTGQSWALALVSKVQADCRSDIVRRRRSVQIESLETSAYVTSIISLVIILNEDNAGLGLQIKFPYQLPPCINHALPISLGTSCIHSDARI
jgi:hypothetical protein